MLVLTTAHDPRHHDDPLHHDARTAEERTHV
jgi:hypothetical protein